jgi:small subunit ribosomal protein S9
MEVINTSGRRKKSVARIYMVPGKGKVQVNNKKLEDFFPVKNHQLVVNQPLSVTDNLGKFDINVNVNGGGITGQASAISLAISKGLVTIDAELKPVLREHGLMTRDPRMVERKKPGQKKARKKFQFSKR